MSDNSGILLWWLQPRLGQETSKQNIEAAASCLREMARTGQVHTELCNWLADALDGHGASPIILVPRFNGKKRPKGTGADWYTIGVSVETLISNGMPKSDALKEVARSHVRQTRVGPTKLTARTIRARHREYLEAMKEYRAHIAAEGE